MGSRKHWSYLKVAFAFAGRIRPCFQAIFIRGHEDCLSRTGGGVDERWSGYDSDVADDAIDEADEAKNTHKATVYTVGIFSGADASSAGNSNGTDTQKANWFMQNLSSNEGTVQNPSYYLSASDSAALNTIFKTISENIENGGSSITLDEKAVVQDVITDQFILPNGADKTQIKVYTANCNGADASGNLTFGTNTTFADAVVDIDGQNVTVTNFNFADNWCGTETTNGTAAYRGNTHEGATGYSTFRVVLYK